MRTKWLRAVMPAVFFACLFPAVAVAAANAHHRHHHPVQVVEKAKAKPHHFVHKIRHISPDAPTSVVAAIRKTADDAAPPPLPVAALQFIQDVVDVIKNTSSEAFDFVRNPVDEAREYIERTSSPGYTMFLQGRKVSLSCLNPDFAVRLADAIKEAREKGVQAGVSSACRPPILGVGGMRDKAQSLHAVGLAVDVSGIGSPGSTTANLWYKVAASHGIIRPYATSWEWNHMQPTSIKVASQVPSMKKLVSQYGPTDLVKMWETQAKVIISMGVALTTMTASAPVAHHHHHGAQHVARA